MTWQEVLTAAQAVTHDENCPANPYPTEVKGAKCECYRGELLAKLADFKVELRLNVLVQLNKSVTGSMGDFSWGYYYEEQVNFAHRKLAELLGETM